MTWLVLWRGLLTQASSPSFLNSHLHMLDQTHTGNDGYSVRFGLVRVNYYEPPFLQRNVKDSGYWVGCSQGWMMGSVSGHDEAGTGRLHNASGCWPHRALLPFMCHQSCALPPLYATALFPPSIQTNF